MDAEALDEEVFRLSISSVARSFAAYFGAFDQFFMSFGETGHEVLGGKAAFHFFDRRHRGERGKATRRESIHGADLLGYEIDASEEFLILRLEERMEGEKIGADDIPVREVRLGEQSVSIGDEVFEAGDDCRSGVCGGL